MDFVAVDLGASSTRYTSINGKVNFLPNDVAFVREGRFIETEKLDDVIENNLDISIEKEGDSKFFPMHVFIGVMADRKKLPVEIPSQMRNKVDQPINYMSAVVSVALSKLKDPTIGDRVNLFVALPPAEVELHKNKFKAEIAGKYKVTFHMIGSNGTTIEFTINEVYCYEESRMALIQYMFDSQHPDRIAKYSGCNILSIDIGASTTDLVIFKNGTYMERTGRTYKIGGKSARDYLMQALSAEMGEECNKEYAEQALIEGRVKNGNKYKDVAGLVDEAKEFVARQIVSNMDMYFAAINTPIRSVNYVIVSGGGSMESSYIDDDGIKHETSKPISSYIEKALKDVCDGIDVEYFGDEPRTANIRGLGMFAALTNGEVKQ